MPKGVITVDFSSVEERGGRVEPGDYVLKVMKIELRKGQSSGNRYVNLTTQIASEGEAKGSTIYHTCSLQPQALWNLRNTLQAMGKKIPQKSVNISLKSLIGQKFGATLDDDEYEGTTRSKVVDVFKPELLKKKAKAEKELDEEEEEEEETDDEDEEEEEEESDEDEEEEEEDLEELEEL